LYILSWSFFRSIGHHAPGAIKKLEAIAAVSDSRPEQEQERYSIEWALWFQWVLATTLGWVLGWALVGQLAIGGAVGIGQWLVLRRLGPHTVWWIFASTLGWLAGWLLVVSGFIVPPDGTGLTTVISGAVLGTAMGLAQWLVLRRWVHDAGWWVFASVVAWTVALTGLLGSTIVGAIVGALTGFLLDWLLRNPRSER
jgi:hypothetical protein